jgi:hypothetical protein
LRSSRVDGSAHCRQDATLISVYQFTLDVVPGLELPSLIIAVVGLIEDSIDVVAEGLRDDRSPNVDAFPEKTYKYFGRFRHGR